MRRKTLSVIAFFLSFSLYFSCVDEGVDVSGLSQNAPVTDLMAYAKNLVGEKGEGCSLIDLQKDKPNSRAATDYSTVATPLWDKAWTEQCGAEEVLVVPLQSEDEIRSAMYYEDGLYRRLQHTRTFSRLVIRKKGEDTISQIFTYLPTYHYTKIHEGELESIAVSPLTANYYGTILMSGLDGTFHQGFYYETGKALVRFTSHQHTEPAPVHLHTDNASTESHHHHAHSYNVRLKLSTNLSMHSRSYNEGDEIIGAVNCPSCGKTASDCSCKDIDGKLILCDDCGWFSKDCNCDSLRCTFCNKLKCICAVKCVACKKYPCICTPKRCDHCLKYYCNGECLESKPEEENPEEEPEDDSTIEITPMAKTLFSNSDMMSNDWQELENMLEEITLDCLGEELYNALKNTLNGTTIPFCFTSGTSVGFGSYGSMYGGGIGITLNYKAESFHLLREMMNAYRALTMSTSLYESTRLNGEIESCFAEYLYISRSLDLKNGKWDRWYSLGTIFEDIMKLENVLDSKGQLRSGKNSSDLTDAVNAAANSLRKSTVYSSYAFDASRTGLENFSIINNLTANCP